MSAATTLKSCAIVEHSREIQLPVPRLCRLDGASGPTGRIFGGHRLADVSRKARPPLAACRTRVSHVTSVIQKLNIPSPSIHSQGDRRLAAPDNQLFEGDAYGWHQENRCSCPAQHGGNTRSGRNVYPNRSRQCDLYVTRHLADRNSLRQQWP